MKKSLKSKLGLALGFAAVLASLSFTSCQKKEKEFVFKIGTANSGLCGAPLHIGIDKGIFEEEFKKAGIKWTSIEIDIQKASELAVAGQIDASLGLAGSLIPQMDNGLDVSFLTGVHTGCTKFYVKKDSPVNSLDDLVGQTVGFCGVQDSSTIAFQRKFFELGHTAYGPGAEFKIAVYNMPDLPLALENGAVAAVGLHDPIAYIAEKDYGFKKILDTTEDEKFSQEYCCLTFVAQKTLEKHPEAVKAFVRGVLKASAYVRANPADSAHLQIENGQMTGDENSNAYLLGTYNYTPSVKLARKTLENSIKELVEIGVLTKVENEEDFINSHFAEFSDVPDSYVYKSDGTYEEVSIDKL